MRSLGHDERGEETAIGGEVDSYANRPIWLVDAQTPRSQLICFENRENHCGIGKGSLPSRSGVVAFVRRSAEAMAHLAYDGLEE